MTKHTVQSKAERIYEALLAKVDYKCLEDKDSKVDALKQIQSILDDGEEAIGYGMQNEVAFIFCLTKEEAEKKGQEYFLPYIVKPLYTSPQSQVDEVVDDYKRVMKAISCEETCLSKKLFSECDCYYGTLKESMLDFLTKLKKGV